MPTLREILDKQKAAKEKSSGFIGGKVLQPKAVQIAEKTLPAEAAKTEGNIQPQTTTIEQKAPTGFNTNPVVEQGPPAGLSALQLIKWKREHAHVPVSNTNKSASLVEDKKIEQVHSISMESSSDKVASSGPKLQNEKPIRSLSNGQIDAAELRRNLEYLANNIEQKELVGQVVRTIAMQLHNSPELMPYMKDADVDLVVRGLRRSYAIVARKKSEAADAKRSKDKMGNDLAAAFKDAGFEGVDIFK